MIEFEADRKWWVIALWVLGAVVLAILTVTTGGLFLGVVLLGLLLIALWIIGGRAWDRLRHGKPMIRNRRSGGD